MELQLAKEPLLDRDGNSVGEGDKQQFKQHDVIAAKQMLTVFKVANASIEDYKNYINVVDKFDTAWRDDLDTVSLSVSEGAFLKKFLEEFSKNAQDANLVEFHIRTILHIVEQLNAS